jgi:sortase A
VLARQPTQPVAPPQDARGPENDQLEPGDEVLFSTGAGEHSDVVTGTQIVKPDALWIVDPTDTPTATLFACHPLGSTAERIVVNLALSS